MKANLSASLASLLAALAMPGWAGSIYQAAAVANPQMQVKDGAVSGCGFQLKALPVDAVTGKSPAVMIDVSFNIYANSLAMMKGGAGRVNLKDPAQWQSMPITGFWAKAKGQQAPTPLGGKVIPAETRGYLLYGTTFGAVMPLFDAVLGDQPLMISAQLKGEPVERIYSATPKTSAEEKRQIMDCMSELIAAMSAQQGAGAASAP